MALMPAAGSPRYPRGMTGPTPTPPPRNEAEYAKKLALAILSTLEQKGFLSRLDVDTILHAAHRSASPTPAPAPAPVPLGGPAALGTRWVKAETAAKPAAPVSQRPVEPKVEPTKTEPITEPNQTEPNQGTIILGDEPKEDEPKQDGPKVNEPKQDTQKSVPPVIDFSVD